MSAVTSLFKTPKPAPLPPKPEERDIVGQAEQAKRKALRGRVETVLTSGQGLSVDERKKSILGVG